MLDQSKLIYANVDLTKKNHPNKWVGLKYPNSKGKILTRTGAFQKSIHYQVDEECFIIKIRKHPYAVILNFGGNTKAHVIKPKKETRTDVHKERSFLHFSESKSSEILFPAASLHDSPRRIS